MGAIVASALIIIVAIALAIYFHTSSKKRNYIEIQSV